MLGCLLSRDVGRVVARAATVDGVAKRVGPLPGCVIYFDVGTLAARCACAAGLDGKPRNAVLVHVLRWPGRRLFERPALALCIVAKLRLCRDLTVGVEAGEALAALGRGSRTPSAGRRRRASRATGRDVLGFLLALVFDGLRRKLLTVDRERLGVDRDQAGGFAAAGSGGCSSCRS